MNEMNNQKVELTLGLVNGVLQYLGTRPFSEVFMLVQEIQAQATPQVKVPTPEAAALND